MLWVNGVDGRPVFGRQWIFMMDQVSFSPSLPSHIKQIAGYQRKFGRHPGRDFGWEIGNLNSVIIFDEDEKMC